MIADVCGPYGALLSSLHPKMLYASPRVGFPPEASALVFKNLSLKSQSLPGMVFSNKSQVRCPTRLGPSWRMLPWSWKLPTVPSAARTGADTHLSAPAPLPLVQSHLLLEEQASDTLPLCAPQVRQGLSGRLSASSAPDLGNT